MNRITKTELKYIKEVLSNNFRSSKGSIMMNRLEDIFCKTFDIGFAIAHTNGTATMHSILEAIELAPGDEVIVPPLTMSSTAFAVLQANATPIFADVCEDSFLIDPKSVEKRITNKTKAIITVSLYGLSPDMDSIMKIAKKHNLIVIEDNAETMLGMYKNKKVGTLGHAASYSFQSSKHITSGEGGMVITNDNVLALRIRKASSLGYAGVSEKKGKISKNEIQNPDYSRHESMGWNYRLSEICSAVALGQMERVNELVNARKKAAKAFLKVIDNCTWLVPQKAEYSYDHTYWTFVVKLNHPNITWVEFRDKFIELGGDGIYAAWKLSYLEPMFQNRKLLGRENFISEDILSNYKSGLCPVAETLQPKLLQFKTNYWKYKDAKKQANILKETLEYFENIYD